MKSKHRSNSFTETILTWQNISVFADVFDGVKTIIDDVDGIAKPGQLTALMGASGAGKTTLLNTLTFKNNKNLKVVGDIKINGRYVQSTNQISSIAGYVQQDDLFIETLKVKEHLKFQAMLRLPQSISKEEKNKRVEEVLVEVF
jgi:ATP-binding cassette, subfamily G (WHITE), eye pigment precursor transporter